MAGTFASTAPAGVSTGLLDLLLGNSNPLAQFADSHQNVLGALGAGLAAGPTFSQGLANAAQNIPAAKASDYQTSLYRSSLNQTEQYLRAKHPDLADAVHSGTLSPRDAYNLAYTRDNPTPVSLAPGASLVNPYTGATVAGGNPGGGFYGGDLKSQAWNTVIKANSANADPTIKSSPQYRAAWAIVTQPTMTPQGMMQPNVPPAWAPDAAPAPMQGSIPGPGAPQFAPPAAPASAAQPGATTPTSAALGDMSMLAPPSPAQNAPGIVPGTRPFNESQARVEFLAQSAAPDLKRVIDGFPALMNTKDQLLSKLGDVGRVAQSPEYRQATDAMTSAMGNILYFASGANLNEGEIRRKIQAYVPSVGDDPQTSVNKLDRFANDVLSAANATNDPKTIAWVGQAVQGIKATEQKILSAGAKPQQQTVPAGTPIWGPDGKQYVMGPDGTPQPVM